MKRQDNRRSKMKKERRPERKDFRSRDSRANKYEDNSAFEEGLQLEGRNPVMEALNHDKPIDKIIVGSITCWLTSLVLIPIQLWVATCGGVFMSMVIGFTGMLLGVLIAPTNYWIVFPWSWTTRLMCPIIGVHPNNTLLSAGDPLLNSSVIPMGIIVSLFTFFAFSLITALWFKLREVK